MKELGRINKSEKRNKGAGRIKNTAIKKGRNDQTSQKTIQKRFQHFSTEMLTLDTQNVNFSVK